MQIVKTLFLLVVRDPRVQAILGSLVVLVLEILSRFAESPDGRGLLGSFAVAVALITPVTEAIKRLFGGAAQAPRVGPGGSAAGPQ